MKQYIQEHYEEEIELGQLAAHVFLTPSYLSKYFKAETKQTITEFIMEIRMAKARELLNQESRLKTYEVGMKVGYSDPAYFNRVFKKAVGVTPKQYRKQVKMIN